MAASRNITVTIHGDASPLILELRKAENTIKRLSASRDQDPPLSYWRGVKAGMRFARAMDQVKRSLQVKVKPDERNTE